MGLFAKLHSASAGWSKRSARANRAAWARQTGRARSPALFEVLESRQLLTVAPLTLADLSYAGVSAFGDSPFDAGNSSTPSMSTDGQLIAFQSKADNLVPNDTNGQSDVFLYLNFRRFSDGL